MTNTTQTCGRLLAQDGQETNPIFINSETEQESASTTEENNSLLVSVFESLNTLKARISRLDYLTKKYLDGQCTSWRDS